MPRRANPQAHFAARLAGSSHWLAFDGPDVGASRRAECAVYRFLSNDLVLGSEVVDDLLLLSIDSAGEDEEEKLPRLQDQFMLGPMRRGNP